MVVNPFLIFLEAMSNSYIGRHVIFLCVIDCEFGLNVNKSIPYLFKKGSLYGTCHTPWFPLQKNPVYTETIDGGYAGKGNYNGAVTVEFINEYFITFE
jgi:hypothetical protein